MLRAKQISFILSLLTLFFVHSSHANNKTPPLLQIVEIMSLPQTYHVGDNISVVLTNAPGNHIDEWVGVFEVDTNRVLFWEETEGINNGQIDFLSSVSTAGVYELRYYLFNSHKALERIPLTILASDQFSIKPSKKYFRSDENISVTLSNTPENIKDWVGLYHKDEMDNKNHLFWAYTNGLDAGILDLNKSAPAIGNYEVRFFQNNTYQLIGKSALRVEQEKTHRIELIKNKIHLNEEIMLIVPSAPGNSLDWVGIYAADETNDHNYLAWKYLPTINEPLTLNGLPNAGEYEVRLFFNNSYQRESSTTLEITPADIQETTIALLGDISWIEPQVFQQLVTAAWPTNQTTTASIKSHKEIVSAFDVLHNQTIPVTQNNGVYEISVPPFSFVNFINVQYRDALDNPTQSMLPEWSTRSLLNGYTALSAGHYYKTRIHGDAFLNAELVFNKLGFTKYTRMAKGHTTSFSTMWPSEAIIDTSGTAAYTEIEDSVLLMGERAHENDLDLITYYKDMGDFETLKVHPEWECKTPDGLPTEDIFIMMDFSSPWKEVVLQQLNELADRGSKGAYFDYVHSPHWGCYGSTMQQLFEAETGLVAPTITAQGYHWSNHENWVAYMEFQAAKTAEAFQYWKTGVKQNHPDFIFIVAGGWVSGLTSVIQGYSIAEVADIVKVEFDHGRSLGLRHSVFYKDSQADNNLAKPSENILLMLAHLVPANFSLGEKFSSWAYGFSDSDQLKGFIASTLALGGMPDVFIPEQYLRSDFNPDDYVPFYTAQTPYNSIIESTDFGKTISNTLKKKNSIKFAGVFFDEDSRNTYKTDYEAAWRNVIWPSVGAYESFLQAGVPVTAINKNTIFTHIGSLKVIYIPVLRTNLSTPVQQLLTDFESNGGIIIDRDENIKWAVPADNANAFTQFASKISPYRQNSDFWVDQGVNDTTVYPFFYH